MVVRLIPRDIQGGTIGLDRAGAGSQLPGRSHVKIFVTRRRFRHIKVFCISPKRNVVAEIMSRDDFDALQFCCFISGSGCDRETLDSHSVN